MGSEWHIYRSKYWDNEVIYLLIYKLLKITEDTPTSPHSIYLKIYLRTNSKFSKELHWEETRKNTLSNFNFIFEWNTKLLHFLVLSNQPNFLIAFPNFGWKRDRPLYALQRHEHNHWWLIPEFEITQHLKSTNNSLFFSQ